MTTLTEAKAKFQNEWIAFLIRKRGSQGEIFGELIEHEPNKSNLHHKLRQRKVADAYITFAGPYVKPGYEVMFLYQK